MQPIHTSKSDIVLAPSPHPTISSLSGKVRVVKCISNQFICFLSIGK